MREGFIPFRGRRTWVHAVGDGQSSHRIPLLCLHGGPGIGHDYLKPLEALASTGRQVILYDQLGCGNSDSIEDPSILEVRLYVEEVDAVRRALKLDRVHIFGHSWGGMLAMEYAMTRPRGLCSLTLADTSPSMPRWIAEMNKLVSGLPSKFQHALRRYEEGNANISAECAKAISELYSRHICRLRPPPKWLSPYLSGKGGTIYRAMWGPFEFHVDGKLKQWDVTSRLSELHLPTLVVGGRYDEATPALGALIHEKISGSQWVVFEKSSHLPHIEEPELFLSVLEQFLEDIEAGSKRREDTPRIPFN